MTAIDTDVRIALRRADFSLSDEQRALRDSFAAMLERECPSDRVRDAEPLGFDEKLWRQLLEMQIVAMGVPIGAGGEGAGLVELALVAEQMGRRLAPVPFIESTVAARLLARCGAPASALLDDVLEDDRLATVALHRARPGHPQLVPAGAAAAAVVGLVRDQVIAASSDDPPPLVTNHGCTPLGLWDIASDGLRHDVMLTGPDATNAFEDAVREWKLLMAAAQVGIAEGALRLALNYARDRIAFGVPISTFQGVSHPLVDCHIAIIGARRLVWKAAWFADHEPEVDRHLIPMAFAYACRAAMRAATVGIHTQGGLGFTLESDMQLFFRRAKGWANVAGDPRSELDHIADALYGRSSG